MSGGTRLIIRSLEGFTDPVLNGTSLWTREVIPIQIPSGTEAEIAVAIQSAPAYSNVVLGRRPNCFIVLSDPSVSGNHCQITVAKPPVVKRSPSSERQQGEDTTVHHRIFITDNSTNGTYIDGRRLRRNQPTLLMSKSLVSLGRSAGETGTFTFQASVDCSGLAAPVDLTADELLAEDDAEDQLHHREGMNGAAGAAQRTTTTLTSRLATAREEKSPSGGKHSTPPRNRWIGCCSTTQSTMSGSGFVAPEAPVSASRTSGSSRLVEVIKRLQEENAKKDDEIAEIAEELDCAEGARKGLREENEGLIRQLDHMRNQLASAQSALEDAKALAMEADTRSAGLVTQIDRLQASRASAAAEAHREAERWRERAAEWEAQHCSTTRRLEAAQLQLQEAFQDRQGLRNRVTELTAQLEEAEHKQRQAVMAVDSAKAEAAAVTRAAESAACDAADREDRLDKQLKQAHSKFRAAELSQSKASEENTALRRDLSVLTTKQRELEDLVEVQATEIRKISDSAQIHREALENNRRLSVTLSELARQTYAMARTLSEEKLPPHYDATKTPPTTRMKVTPDTDCVPGAAKVVPSTYFQKAALLSRCLEGEEGGTWPIENTPPLKPSNKRAHDNLWTDDEEDEENIANSQDCEPAPKRARDDAHDDNDLTPTTPTPVFHETGIVSTPREATLEIKTHSEVDRIAEEMDTNDYSTSGSAQDDRNDENHTSGGSEHQESDAKSDLDAVLAPADFENNTTEDNFMQIPIT